jgi:hypothetical protein
VTASGTAAAAPPPPPPGATTVGGVAVRRRTTEGAGQLPRPWAAHAACTAAPMSASTVEAFAKAETRLATTADAEDGDGEVRAASMVSSTVRTAAGGAP